jgi:altronate dehydratase large subunit
MTFLGYVRENGLVGIRNIMLVISATRGAANLAYTISSAVKNSILYVAPNENGRTQGDRTTIARIITGLAKNANVGAVLIVGIKPDGGYAEFTYKNIVENIQETGKPVGDVFISRDGGYYACLGSGIEKGRNLAEKCSEYIREEVEFGKLSLAVKCGYSDATSGMAGNPVVGYVFDKLYDAGGTTFFSETTEVIGAETIVAERFSDQIEKQKFLDAVNRIEEQAKATGQDIRSINPIPANIEAGLTTIEEKSLGAIAKAGTRPISKCLQYGEAPGCPGLHYMDSWMSATALFLGFAAAGATMNIFQFGGGAMPDKFMLPMANTGLVAPIIYSTGNPRAYERGKSEIDYNSGVVISDKRSIEETGDLFIKLIRKVASGKFTRGETLNVKENLELYLQGPCL